MKSRNEYFRFPQWVDTQTEEIRNDNNELIEMKIEIEASINIDIR